MQLTYSGNHLSVVTDNGAPESMMGYAFHFVDGYDYRYEYEYDGCGSMTDKAVTQSQVRDDYNISVGKITDPDKVGMPDLGRFKYAANKVGKQAEVAKNFNRQYIFDQMQLGDDFGITYTVFGVDKSGNNVTGLHTVLMKKAKQTTWIKHDGTTVIHKPKLWVMDPAHGGSIHRIHKRQLERVMRVFK